MTIDMTTRYAGLTLKNPLIAGSSGLTSTAKRVREAEKAGVGAAVLKSLFEEQIEMQGDELMAQSADSPAAEEYLRSYVRAHQIDEYLTLIRDCKSQCSIPIIASVNCYKPDGWAEFAGHIREAGADAIELNVFYLYSDPTAPAGQAAERYAAIVRTVKKHAAIPVTVKIGRYFDNVPALVHVLKQNGADGVVLFNRYYQPNINIETQQLVSGSVLSHPGDLGDTLRWTALVAGRVPGIPVCASSGIHNWQDIIKCLMAGASAVQVCSAAYHHGVGIYGEMLEAVTAWLEKEKYHAASEVIGRLSYSGDSDKTSFYERAQFMKYFSDREE